jgi:hypothetical protein
LITVIQQAGGDSTSPNLEAGTGLRQIWNKMNRGGQANAQIQQALQNTYNAIPNPASKVSDYTTI